MQTYQSRLINKINVINDTNKDCKKLQHELINNACFNNKLWRSILNKIISEIDIHNVGLQIISPFGFEVDIFYNDSLLYKTADSGDVEILNELIVPRVERMINHISQMEDLVTITAKSYHVDDEINLVMGKSAYLQAKQVIQEILSVDGYEIQVTKQENSFENHIFDYDAVKNMK